MGLLRNLSERVLRVVSQHGNRAVLMGTPLSFSGAPAVVAAFLVTFFAVEKSDSPVGRDPQCLSKQKAELYEHSNPIVEYFNAKPNICKQENRITSFRTCQI